MANKVKIEWESIDNVGAACNEMFLIATEGAPGEAKEFFATFPKLTREVITLLSFMTGMTLEQHETIRRTFMPLLK